MRDWLFSDMGFLFFTAWSVMLAAISYAAFVRDLQPSKVLARNKSFPAVTTRDTVVR